MQYSTENFQISFTLALASFLNSKGYDVLWKATGDTQAQTAGLPEAIATVTLVPDFPANPQVLVRLRGEATGAEAIVIPALCLRVLGAPQRRSIMGLGHTDYVWQRKIRIDGFGADEFQQRALMDLLHDWLNSEERKEFPVYDYSTTPASPTLLGNAWIHIGAADLTILVHEVEAVRYYVFATAMVQYIE